MQQKTTPGTITTKLSEIFTSIEGEGILFGTKTMFVRLAGCPFKCHWCDTPYALPMDSGIDYSVEEVKEISQRAFSQTHTRLISLVASRWSSTKQS